MIGSKTALTVGSIAVALMFGGGLYLYLNINSIAERLAERVASKTLGVDVGIDAVEISLRDKQVIVRNIMIANPPGYSRVKAMEVENILVRAESLSQELLKFSSAEMNGLSVNLEVAEKGINLSDIRKNIKIQQGTAGKKDQAVETRVIVEEFKAENGVINPSVRFLKRQDVQSVNIPVIRLERIGKQENGVLAQEAVAQIFNAIAQAAIHAANQEGFLRGLDKDTLKEAGISKVRQFKDQIHQDAEDAVDKVKGLFGN